MKNGSELVACARLIIEHTPASAVDEEHVLKRMEEIKRDAETLMASPVEAIAALYIAIVMEGFKSYLAEHCTHMLEGPKA